MESKTMIDYKAKATAYDIVMGGGKKTLKEWANIFGMPVGVYEATEEPVTTYSNGKWHNPTNQERGEKWKRLR